MVNKQALVVTGIVALVGGVAGAVGGGLIMAAIDLATGGTIQLDANTLPFYGIATGIGFAHGLILGPALGWAFLRDTPLWRAIGETAVAASIGAAVAIFSGWSLLVASGCALVAAGLAAGRLRLSTSRRRAKELPPAGA